MNIYLQLLRHIFCRENASNLHLYYNMWNHPSSRSQAIDGRGTDQKPIHLIPIIHKHYYF